MVFRFSAKNHVYLIAKAETVKTVKKIPFSFSGFSVNDDITFASFLSKIFDFPVGSAEKMTVSKM